MDPLTNPFGVLTFIAAPAILTNASSVMALGTSNRFARAIDRVRALSAELGSQTAMSDALKQLRLKQLRFAGRRVLLLVRALAAFYVSLGAFAAASLTSLVGASLVLAHLDVPRVVIMVVAFVCGGVGVGGLVTGSVLLVWESRLTLTILREETEFVVQGLHLGPQEEEDKTVEE
jgi:hypothetical protein